MRDESDDPLHHERMLYHRAISLSLFLIQVYYRNFLDVVFLVVFLFNNALNTFYLRLYGIRHMVKDHSDSEKGNPLPPHRLLFPINSKGSFICTIPQTG